MELVTKRFLSEALGWSFFICVILWWGRFLSRRNAAESNNHGGDRKEILPDTDDARDIIQQMKKRHKDCVVFFGSQTGTAESYALRLVKEGKTRFGLETMAANLEDYDLNNLDIFPRGKIAIFFMSTYGEGEPPDSAVESFDLLTGHDRAFATSGSLSNLTYAAFGLGNKTYEYYNGVIRKVTQALDEAGADRLGEVGEADDGAGTTEEDFLAWKETMWPVVAKHMGVSEGAHRSVFTPSFGVTECHDLTTDSPGVYLGEPNERYLKAEPRDIPGPFDAHHPYLAPVTGSRELIAPSGTSRNCVHVEVSLTGSGLTYETGDHAAVWPSNPTEEVERILRVLGLGKQSQTVIKLNSADPLVHVPFPTPTTYEAIMRYYLDIAGPISQQIVSEIMPFAPNEKAQEGLSRLTADRGLFHAETHFSTLSRFLEKVGGAEIEWTQIPFSLLVESLPKLQPRFYSISSSSLAQPEKVSLTVAVESAAVSCRQTNDPFCGIASNYLLAVGQAQRNELASQRPRYDIGGPRQKLLQNAQVRVPIHIRHSNFKLPKDTNTPVIMIGPGTGVAPFRGFVQERAKQVSDGTPVGLMLLFFGCRKRSEDFLYEREWEEHKQTLGPSFSVFTAFSRDQKDKVYVQHLLKQHAAQVLALLQRGAFVYVCGDAKYMAKEVGQALLGIIADGSSMSLDEAAGKLKSMRLAGHYQEDVWA